MDHTKISSNSARRTLAPSMRTASVGKARSYGRAVQVTGLIAGQRTAPLTLNTSLVSSDCDVDRLQGRTGRVLCFQGVRRTLSRAALVKESSRCLVSPFFSSILPALSMDRFRH